MVFYNHCLEGETLTAIVAFPFTPTIVNKMTPTQIIAVSKVLGFTYESEGATPIELAKQKLLDMWYTMEDSSRMHGIVPCQSIKKACNNLASSLNANFLCKLCNDEVHNRLPSLIHDSHDQYFRHKLRILSEFEDSQGFDRKKVIRIVSRRGLKEHELKQVLSEYNIEWESMKIWYNQDTYRIQYIYLPCRTEDEAKRLLLNRHLLSTKFQRGSVVFEALANSLKKAFDLFNEPENVAVFITPPSSMEVVEELPKGDELVKLVINIVQAVTQLDASRFTIEPDVNSISGEPDYRHIYVVLPNRTYVNRIYEAQPYYGALICHKLTHVQVTPYIRYASDICFMCNEQKEEKCIRDMCVECCSKQKNIQTLCDCSTERISDIIAKRKGNPSYLMLRTCKRH